MTVATERTYIVAMTEAEIGRFLAAVEEAPNLIAQARSICDALYAMVSQDQVILDEMTGFLDMSARGFQAAEKLHGSTMLSLADRLRDLQSAIDGLRPVSGPIVTVHSTLTEGGSHDH